VLEALEAARGRVLRVAEVLGVARRTVYYDLDRHDLWGELERVRREDVDGAREAAARTFRALVPDVEPPALPAAPCWWSTRRTA
jgi:hypothetical protein